MAEELTHSEQLHASAVCPICDRRSFTYLSGHWEDGCKHCIGRLISGSGKEIAPTDTVTFLFERVVKTKFGLVGCPANVAPAVGGYVIALTDITLDNLARIQAHVALPSVFIPKGSTGRVVSMGEDGDGTFIVRFSGVFPVPEGELDYEDTVEFAPEEFGTLFAAI